MQINKEINNDVNNCFDFLQNNYKYILKGKLTDILTEYDLSKQMNGGKSE